MVILTPNITVPLPPFKWCISIKDNDSEGKYSTLELINQYLKNSHNFVYAFYGDKYFL